MNAYINAFWSPLYWRGFALFLAWMSNVTHQKVWDEITYPSQISTVQPLKFGIG